MNKFLTIVIPTYNREKRLIRLLRSIERQNAVDKYYIVILNNHSSYNVEKSLSDTFSGEFFDNIEIYNRPYNAGGDYNIGSAFLFAKSDFLWIIGDDDEVIDGCINIIEEDSIRYNEIPFFKYPSNMPQKCDEDILVSNISQFKELNIKGLLTAGNIIFVSNNIYNIPQLEPYISTSLYYSYCSTPHSLPMLRCLMDERPFLLSNKDIVRYLEPDGDHWNYVKIALSICTLLDINEGDKYYIVRDFFRVITQHFNIRHFLFDCLNIKDKLYRKYVYQKGLQYIFENKTVNDWISCFMFRVELFTGLNALSRYVYIINSYSNMKNKFIISQRNNNGVVFRIYKIIKRFK